MRLKSIKLAGFKSFVDPTTVQFKSNMAAVVGPNGCGKSNIIDAVRWVMGESSAKNLRGESMSDVIFNGSTARKPVGQASIELVFENNEGKLKGEYGAFNEISIKRKVTRDGQSQYFINNVKSRRRDITDIFLGTGLGPRSYAIIEQGMISRLIESKPEELRVFVEEAAGISKYKERRKETETRIRHSRENLERLTDLREELERQLQKLKRQSAAAEKYKEYKAEESELKAQTLALHWQSLREKSQGQRDNIAKLEIDFEASVAKQRAIEAEIETLREAQTVSKEELNKVQAEFYGLGGEIGQLEQKLDYCEQRAKELQQDFEDTELQAAEANQHLTDDQKKLGSWKEELETILPQHEALATTEAESSQALQTAEQNMQDWQQRWDTFNEKANEPQKNAEIQRNRIDQVEETLKNLVNRTTELLREKTELDDQDFTNQLESQREQLAVFSGEATEVAEMIASATDSLQLTRQKQKEVEQDLNQLRSELQQMYGKAASLDALQKAAQSDTGDEINEFLSRNNLNNKPRLLDQIKVTSGWDVAVETVLGDSLQAVMADSLSGLEQVVNNIQSSNLLLIENTDVVKSSQQATSITLPRLSDKIQLKHAGNFSLLENIYAADTLSEAASQRSDLASNESIVTKEGIWLGVDWIRVYRGQEGTGVIDRQEQIETLATEIQQKEQQVEQLETVLLNAESVVAEAEQSKDQAMQKKSEVDSQFASMQSEVRSLENTIEQVNKRQRRIQDELQQSENNQAVYKETLAEARVLLEEAIESMHNVEEERESMMLQRDKLRDVLTITRESAKTDREAYQAVAVRAEGLKAQIESVTSTVSRLEKQVELLSAKKETLQQSLQENNEPVEGLKATLVEQLEARVQVEASLTASREKVEAEDQKMRAFEQQRSEQEQSNQVVRGALEKARIESQEMQVRTKTIEEQLEESGHELQQVIENLPEEAELQAWQTSLDELVKRIERLGAINLAAIEEYQTELERKKYLDAQNDELESALATLESAIHKIDKETRNLFKETFDKLNDSLQELFPKVFGGGAANLEMTGDDLLSTGITIMARPPGKKNSTIHLLSGGEKALTAIALVFSIFQLNPAPFCMLDEVDAPLDDANTMRYARMISEMSSKVQFIFITHNKITMEMADHLMGVTMHEPGCSRLVSVDIDEAVAMATA